MSQIKEGFANQKLHKNPSYEQVINLAKTSNHHESRFIVHDNKLSMAGDAEHFIHSDLLPTTSKYSHLRGFVTGNWDKKNEKYYVRLRNPNGEELFKHPIIDEFKKHGVKTYFNSEGGTVNELYSLVYHKQLNPKLFVAEKLKPEVRDALLNIAHTWQEKIELPDECITDIIFTGSNCNYNYSRFSDCDVHIVYDEKVLPDDPVWLEKYLRLNKTLWSMSHKVKVKGYPVELYAQKSDEKLVASGVYSLLRDDWIIFPIHGNYKFSNDLALKKKVEEIKKTLDIMIEKRVKEKDFKIMKDKLKNMRLAALASGDEFSIDNLVFKALRNSGILDRVN